MKVNVIVPSVGLEEPQKPLVPVWIPERDTVYSSFGVIRLMHRASLIPSIDGEDDLSSRVDGSLGEATHASEEIDDHDWLLHLNDPLWFPVFFFM